MGVPQGSVMEPTLYSSYTADLPTPTETTVAIFADDTRLLLANKLQEKATETLQQTVNEMNDRANGWKIKLNQGKSSTSHIHTEKQ